MHCAVCWGLVVSEEELLPMWTQVLGVVIWGHGKCCTRKDKKCSTGDTAQLVEWLATIHEVLGLIPHFYINCNPSTQEVKAEGSEAQGEVILDCNEFKDSLGCMGPCLYKQTAC